VITISAFSWTTVDLTAAYDGLPVDSGDYPVSDFGIFAISLLALVRLINATINRVAPTGLAKEGALSRSTSECLVLVAAAPHLANYAYSAVEKLSLDGGVLSWMTENPTHWLILNAQTLGTAPLGSWPWFGQMVDLFAKGEVGLNAITLVSQAAAIIAIAFPPFAAVMCVVYDAWHIGVAVTSGIFFWNWMLLNVVLAFAFKSFTTTFCPQFRIALVAFLLFSPSFFNVVNLGWYDTPAINVMRLEAITSDGRAVEVPSDFFRQHSYAFAIA
jgi:hypothetical protein